MTDRPDPSDSNIKRIVDDLKVLSDDDRLEVFSYFCKYCGCDNPACRCWDDE
jgi:hypothetical protein